MHGIYILSVPKSGYGISKYHHDITLKYFICFSNSSLCKLAGFMLSLKDNEEVITNRDRCSQKKTQNKRGTYACQNYGTYLYPTINFWLNKVPIAERKSRTKDLSALAFSPHFSPIEYWVKNVKQFNRYYLQQKSP